MERNNLRYIVFMLDPQTSQYLSGRLVDGVNYGKIFCNREDARKYAMDAIKDKECTRFVIGFFEMDLQAETMGISLIETFGFRHDKSNVEQLELFK
jgi:hypothetical protein